MANSTPCQTNDAIYGIILTQNSVSVKVELPFELELDDENMEILKTNLHNAMELVLARYFK